METERVLGTVSTPSKRVVFFPEDDGKSLQTHKRVYIEELKKVMIVAV